MPVTGTPSVSGSPTIDVTTQSRVKDFLKIVSGETKYDAWIDNAINAVSTQFEKYTNNKFALISRIQFFDVFAGRERFYLDAAPIVSLTDVRYDYDRTFAAESVVDDDNYTILGDDGALIIDRFYMYPGNRVLRVEYTGGFAANTTDFLNLFPDIGQLADAQIAFLHKRRDTIETEGVSEQGASVTLTEVDLLPLVKNGLDRYRRLFLG